MAFYDCAQLLQLGFGVSVIAVRLQCHHSCVKNKATFANMVFHGSLVFYGSPLARADRHDWEGRVGSVVIGFMNVGALEGRVVALFTTKQRF